MITDSAGTEFDPAEHMLADNPLEPLLTATGKFRKLRSGTSNSDDLLELWAEKSATYYEVKAAEVTAEQAHEEAEVKAEKVVAKPKAKAPAYSLGAIADEMGIGFIKKDFGGTFTDGKRKLSVSTANYEREAQVKRLLRAYGF